MTGYVTAEFYKNQYHGHSIPDDCLQAQLDKASMDVDNLTRMKIHKLGGFDKLSDFEKIRVQLAVCSQADYSHLKASMDGLSSYSIGDVSVNFESAGDYDAACLSYLNATMLMYRGL